MSAPAVIRVIDFETTGIPPDAAICEAAWIDVLRDDRSQSWEIVTASKQAWLTNPGRPVPPEASAIHHLVDEDLQAAPPPSEVVARMLAGAEIFAAHSAAFERAFLAEGAGKYWICTLKVARRIWPEAASHSNQALRYWLKLPLSQSLAMPAHRALPDAYVTAAILVELTKKASVRDMIKWSAEPSLLPHVTFGKHRGTPWSELPTDYLEWLAFKSDMDEDAKFTANHWLAKASVGEP